MTAAARRPGTWFVWSTLKTMVFAVGIYVIRPVRDLWRTLSGTHPVRIFTYHRVTEACRDAISISPRLFRRQVQYLMRYHDVTSLDEAVASLTSGDRRRRPLAAITFDDGYESVYTTAFPILQGLGVSGSAFVATGFVGTDRRLPHDEGNPAVRQVGIMDWNDLAALRNSGWTIGSHTVSHARLAECDTERLKYELKTSLEVVSRRLGLNRVFLAFPFGSPTDFTEAGLEAAMSAGYCGCLSNFGGENDGSSDTSHLRRFDIGANIPTLAWKARVHGMPPLWLRKPRDRFDD